MPSDSGVSTEQLRTLFSTIDKDGSGGIDLEEVLEICHVLGLTATEEEMQEMLEAADADQDGVLHYDEFLTIMDQFGVTASSGANQCWTGPTTAASWPMASANSTCCRSCTRYRRS